MSTRAAWRDATVAPIEDIAAAARAIRECVRPPPRAIPVRSSFYFAWVRRWKAHYLSTALGYDSCEPLVR